MITITFRKREVLITTGSIFFSVGTLVTGAVVSGILKYHNLIYVSVGISLIGIIFVIAGNFTLHRDGVLLFKSLDKAKSKIVTLITHEIKNKQHVKIRYIGMTLSNVWNTLFDILEDLKKTDNVHLENTDSNRNITDYTSFVKGEKKILVTYDVKDSEYFVQLQVHKIVQDKND